MRLDPTGDSEIGSNDGVGEVDGYGEGADAHPPDDLDHPSIDAVHDGLVDIMQLATRTAVDASASTKKNCDEFDALFDAARSCSS